MPDVTKFPADAPALGDYEKHTVELIWQRCGCKDPLTLVFIRVALVGVRGFDYKQRNYGPENIAASGAEGVAQRLMDKVSRIKTLLKRVLAAVQGGDEPIEDSFGDSSVYGTIGLMCRWKLWPGSPEQLEAGAAASGWAPPPPRHVAPAPQAAEYAPPPQPEPPHLAREGA